VAPESHAAPSGEDVLVAFDLETTGLSPQNACIIEVGAVKFSPSGEKLGTFQEFCSPGAPIPEEVVKLTGITDDMVTGAKPPLEVVEAFLEWATPPAIYIAHNAEFDLGFLRGAFTRAARKAPEWRVVDTLVWAQSLKLGTPNCKLGTLLEHYRIHADGPLHRSLADATGVMELVLRFTEGQLDPLALITERIGLLPQRRRRRAFV
jgi:DNA polymerase III epsilon subunit family exonuclease